DATPAQQISILPAQQLDEFPAASRTRPVGLRKRLQEGHYDSRRLCLRLRDSRWIPEGLRRLRRQGHPENLATPQHQGLRTLHPDLQGGCRWYLHNNGRPDGAAISETTAGSRNKDEDPG